MSPSPHLQPKQFGTTYEQGKPVSDWLSTEHGHRWQDENFVHPIEHLEGNINTQNFGMYSVKSSEERPGPSEEGYANINKPVRGLEPENYIGPHP